MTPEELKGLRSGSINEGEEYEAGISPRHAARIAIAILEDERRNGGAPSTTPLEPDERLGGPPRGYGKWGGEF